MRSEGLFLSAPLSKTFIYFDAVAGGTGVMGGKLSHEFHIVSDIGEDTLLICDT